ncbi:hypothetical protein Sjap_025661 [Stephania japonica]|uniref:Uncharacterized protein n=1 Tax=Stephania japonica TaxID=461633 RepID=A0AAP0E4P7_9MAGN
MNRICRLIIEKALFEYSITKPRKDENFTKKREEGVGWGGREAWTCLYSSRKKESGGFDAQALLQILLGPNRAENSKGKGPCLGDLLRSLATGFGDYFIRWYVQCDGMNKFGVRNKSKNASIVREITKLSMGVTYWSHHLVSQLMAGMSRDHGIVSRFVCELR